MLNFCELLVCESWHCAAVFFEMNCSFHLDFLTPTTVFQSFCEEEQLHLYNGFGGKCVYVRNKVLAQKRNILSGLVKKTLSLFKTWMFFHFKMAPYKTSLANRSFF